MPRYDFKCDGCGKVETKALPLAQYDAPQTCSECWGLCRRIISGGANVSPDWQPYMEENMGHEPVLVKSRQHYQQLLQERGLNNRYGVGAERQRWV